jgi:secernin
MCDTQVLVGEGAVWFAKNSDREPSEPQPVVRFPAVRGDAATTVRATYIDVPQVPDRAAVLLSRPVWCWGAEMGVNEHGVAIGNEAIFSRRATRRRALLGMDLVRFGLERAASAAQALEVMTGLLEAHGQGGPAGFHDQRFCYDSSFLVADAKEAWVLETAGRDWQKRHVDGRYAISNQLTLDDFARRHDTRLVPYFARARERRALSLRYLEHAGVPSFGRLALHLRAHHESQENPAAGFIRRHQTTGSMIARLTPGKPTVVFTGTSAPCLSIFRPADFAGEFSVLTPAGKEVEALVWRRHEFLHRRALADPDLRHRLRATRDSIEAKVFAELAAAEPSADALQRADRLAAAWHKVLWESLPQRPPSRAPRFWSRVAQLDGIR